MYSINTINTKHFVQILVRNTFNIPQYFHYLFQLFLILARLNVAKVKMVERNIVLCLCSTIEIHIKLLSPAMPDKHMVTIFITNDSMHNIKVVS